MVYQEAVSHLERIQAVPYSGKDDRAWVEAVLPIYLEMLESRDHFAQAAYRDGEFGWITADPTIVNANGEVWEPALGEQLAHTLLRPVGQWCVYFEPTDRRRPAADAWIREHKPPVEWIPDRPFGRANEQGVLAPFFRAVQKRNVCVVGPAHLSRLDLFDFEHLVVPDATAWREADRLAFCVTESDSDLFLIAAGSAANLVIHRAWPDVKHRATLIDVGALLDPYAGVFSRNLYRTEEWQSQVMPRNLP